MYFIIFEKLKSTYFIELIITKFIRLSMFTFTSRFSIHFLSLSNNKKNCSTQINNKETNIIINKSSLSQELSQKSSRNALYANLRADEDPHSTAAD